MASTFKTTQHQTVLPNRYTHRTNNSSNFLC